MTARINRRELIAFGAAAWPIAARGQQAIPVIGFLSSASLSALPEEIASFRQGLKEQGYAEGDNLHIAFRWAEGRYELLPALATELVRNRVAVLTATGGLPSAIAAKKATDTTPIVFIASDPVQSGLVPSINRPGGNLTGVSPLSALLTGKRLGLLHELLPTVLKIGVLANPTYPDVDTQLEDAKVAAQTLGIQIHIAHASTERELSNALAALVDQGVEALLLAADLFLVSKRDQIVDFAAGHKLPAMYGNREYAQSGGLMSFGPSFNDVYRLAGVYTGRILKGEKPADMPVQQSTKFEFLINLKAAKALGVTFPPGLLAIADDVIE
jgi:putative ABC transport system substrate-binding protein